MMRGALSRLLRVKTLKRDLQIHEQQCGFLNRATHYTVTVSGELTINTMMLKIILLIILATVGCSTADMGPEDFHSFENRLNEIIATKDYNGLKSILHDTVFESNDGCGYPGCPTDVFLQLYFQSGIADDWKMLEEIVGEGFLKIVSDSAIVLFQNVDSVYEAPKYLRQINNSRQVIVLSDSLDVKNEPNGDARTIETLRKGEILNCSCCVMYEDNDLIRNQEGALWIRTKHRGDIGYVEARYTSQRPARILEVALINRKWKIVSWYIGECG